MLARRELLKRLGLGLVAAGLPGVTFARTETDARLVLIILRGALDGMATLVPYGEPAYGKLRGELALAKPGENGGVLKLDGLFGLHPSLAHCHALYRSEQAVFFHAVATPYRERSHFDAQDLLENGTASPGGTRDGWLNRALAAIPGKRGGEGAIAMAQNIPLVLRGAVSVASWAPSLLPDADGQTLRRIERLYADDEFFATRLRQALESQELAGDLARARRRNNLNRQAREMMQAAAQFLRAPDGPRIAVIESGGWDTHANQGAGTGSLANKLADLDVGLEELRKAMGGEWEQTAVMVVTEFGRTVRVNGTRGTDHGTAAAAMLLGGAVNGGRIVADWPGLGESALFEGRDLAPTTDLRSVFKGLLADHLGVTGKALDREVFPDSKGVPPMRDLIRSA